MTTAKSTDATTVAPEEEVEKTPAELAAELGPFDPPRDYDFGEEFEGSPRRSIPAFLKRGSHERRWRQRTFTTAILGLGCVAIAQNNFVEEMGYYVLALGYLDWFGAVTLALTGVSILVHLLHPGPYAFVRDGLPTVARVLKLLAYHQGTEQLTTFGFGAVVEYRDPETGRICYKTIRSKPLDNVRRAHRYSATLEPGSYVTAVGLPGRFDKTLTLYGLLGLHPEKDIILKDGAPIREMPTSVVVSLILAIFAVLGLAVLGLYTMEFVKPMGDDIFPVLAAMGVGGSIGLVLGLVLARLYNRKKKQAERGSYIVSGAIGLFCLAATAFVGVGLSNAAFDDSKSSYREIAVVNLWHETWYPLFIRRYEIEYSELNAVAKRRQPTRVEKMSEFGLRCGVIEIGQGALGMQWIRDIHPVMLAEVEPGDPPEATLATVEVQRPDGGKETVALKPVVRVAKNENMAVSEAIYEYLRADKAARKAIHEQGFSLRE